MLRAVDLFAGAGGTTLGAQAAGLRVVFAANHWPEAVARHQANHPEVEHVCQDINQLDWGRVPAHDVLLASPCCQGHSHARGANRPSHDASRMTAWPVVSCAERHTPEWLVVENVPEMIGWNLWPAWEQALRLIGYELTWATIDAAGVGVPQHRERLFVVGRLGGPVRLGTPSVPHVSAGSCIDWESGAWGPVDKPGRSPKTLARIARGREAFGERFLAPYYSSGSGLTGRSLERPCGTLTTRARWGLVDGDRYRMLTVEEQKRIQTFPVEYDLGSHQGRAIHMIGNSVPPLLAEWVLRDLGLGDDR